MIEPLRSHRKERAQIEYNRVVISSMLEDTAINDAIFNHDTSAFMESATGEEVLLELIDKIPEFTEEEAAITKVLDAEGDIDVDEVLGVNEIEGV